jgi:excisionase family DNA binding protein
MSERLQIVLGVVGELRLERELLAGVVTCVVNLGSPYGQGAERLGLRGVGPPAVFEPRSWSGNSTRASKAVLDGRGVGFDARCGRRPTRLGALAGPSRSRSITAMAPALPHMRATLTAQERSAPTLALSVEQACDALGVSWDTWRAHIEPDVRLVRLGRRKLIPVSELQAWLDRHAESVGV